MAEGRMKRTAAIVVLCSVFFGCQQSNVQVGDQDYPKVNPTPSHLFKFRGTIDPKLHIQFRTLWYASISDCYYMTSNIEGASNHYGASLPLNYTLSDSHFEISIATDGVLPGRCGWTFSGISAIKADPQNHALAAAGTYVIVTNSPPLALGKSPNGKNNFDCRPKQGAAYVGCIPKSYKDSLWWYPETSEMEANFYY